MSPQTLKLPLPSATLVALFFSTGAALFASPTSAQEADSVRTVVDEMPKLLPDMETGLQAMQDSTRYPEAAKAAGAEGRVFVRFVVDEEGNVTESEVVKGAHEALDAEAVRVVQTLRFEPGEQRGEPVKVAVAMTMPFTFKLPDDSTDVSSSASQTREPDSTGVYMVVDEMPRLQGGLQALQGGIRYPEAAKADGAEGRVFVRFIVDEEGEVTDPEVAKGVHDALDAEALRVVETLRFEPGQQEGEPVKVRMTMPFTFKLPADSTDAPADSAGAQSGSLPQGAFESYYAAARAYRVTVRSDGGVVSTFEVPEGTFLSVQGRKDQNPSFRDDHGFPHTFRGDLVLRTRRADEVAETESTAAHAIMAKAPLEVRIADAVVVVEQSEPSPSEPQTPPGLAGTWSGMPKVDVTLTYEFRDDGTAMWTMEEGAKTVSVEARYTVDAARHPAEIDFFDLNVVAASDAAPASPTPENARLLGILTFVDEDLIRMDAKADSTGTTARPSQFGNSQVVLQRVEDE